jgi:hypothetical protein
MRYTTGSRGFSDPGCDARRTRRPWPRTLAAALSAAVLAGLAGCGRPRAQLPADTTDIAVQLSAAGHFTSVVWKNVPGPVSDWIATHPGAPATGTVAHAGYTWLVLSSGRQPRQVDLLPLHGTVNAAAHSALIDVDLGVPGQQHTWSSVVAVRLPTGITAGSFVLQTSLLSGAIPLGKVPTLSCTPAATASATVQACLGPLGLKGATLAGGTGGGVLATLAGQDFLVGGVLSGGKWVPGTVTWKGAAS